MPVPEQDSVRVVDSCWRSGCRRDFNIRQLLCEERRGVRTGKRRVEQDPGDDSVGPAAEDCKSGTKELRRRDSDKADRRVRLDADPIGECARGLQGPAYFLRTSCAGHRDLEIRSMAVTVDAQLCSRHIK